MKDKQIQPANAEPRIFFVSALLHCVSMTVLVYLRSSFGFGFLRPKSVFLACSWAFTLYAIYAWAENSVWRQYRAVLVFGGGAMLLYWVQLFTAFIREWQGGGEHEQYSGTSHWIGLLRRAGHAPPPHFEAGLHLWVEPGAVLLVAAILRLVFGEHLLSRWLFVVAVCFWAKEAFNHWFGVRRRKRQQDNFDDTEDAVEPPSSNLAADPLKASRKAKVKRSRETNASGATATED